MCMGNSSEQSGLVQTYMTRTPIHDIQAEEERDEVPIVAVIATPLHRRAMLRLLF